MFRFSIVVWVRLIYVKSDPSLEKVPNFYANKEDALADMKRLAELEADPEFNG